MKIAYFDAFSGLSGDMTIGAFLDLGMPLHLLEGTLPALGLEGVELRRSKRIRSGIHAVKFDVVEPNATRECPSHGHAHEGAHTHSQSDHAHHGAHEHSHHGHSQQGTREHSPDGHPHESEPSHSHHAYRSIRERIERAGIPAGAKRRALAIFHALARAEGKIHGISADQVTFHEVGAVDSIVDIVGAALCLDHFGVDKIFTCPLPLGTGFTRSQHGVIPIPPPATAELLRGFPVRAEDGARELVTPTGAAILAALATPGPPPPFSPLVIGYGAGERELEDRPNLLRVMLGEIADTEGIVTSGCAAPGAVQHEPMRVLEANIDDMNPELYAPAVAELFSAGARDVSLIPIAMKKGRPGTLVQVIACAGDEQKLATILLTHTTTLGVRCSTTTRFYLPRSVETVQTPFGAIQVKIAQLPDGTSRATPEYEDCRRTASASGVSALRVYEAALKASTDLKP